jgi:hypothetical protein
MQRMRATRNIAVGLLLGLAMAQAALAAPLAQSGLVLVTRTGTGPSGEPLFQVADSSDGGAKNLWDKVSSDSEVRRATAIYQKVQEERKEAIRAELAADGSLDAQDRAILRDLPGPHPVYIEVRPGTAGAYNDWKARFSLQSSSGQIEQVAAPRIVFSANDPLASGSNTELLRQTVVHEISHGYHALMVGQNNTPSTPWLSRPHAGNTTSDGTLALIEGYAEFVAAHLTGRLTIADDPANTIPNNLYAYDSEGRRKNGDDLWKTEGWAATVMYKMANDGQIQDGFDKINRVIAESNPQDFRSLVEGFQERYPNDRGAVRGIVAKASFGQIYPDANAGGGGGSQGGSGYDDFTDDFGDPGERWEPQDDDGGSGMNVGKIVAMVGGGVLGAMFGISFGPVGIAVAGAVGVGLGYVIAKLLFPDDGDDSKFSLDELWPSNPFSGSSSTVGVAAAPSTASTMSLEDARRQLDRAYKSYLEALGGEGDMEDARRVYVGAQKAYQNAQKAAR